MIRIEKIKVGVFKPRTQFEVYVDDIHIGDYNTLKEAKRVAQSRVEYNAARDQSLSDEIAQEFDV